MNVLLDKKTTNEQWGIKPDAIHVVAVENCTNKCKFCSTNAPFAEKKSHPASSFFPWLDMLFGDNKNAFKDFPVAITGGEPFLHPDILLFADELRIKYPLKGIGISTNFFWATQEKIKKLAPLFRSLNALLISKYSNIVNKVGGEVKFDELVLLLKKVCPHLDIEVTPMISSFIKWDFHMGENDVLNACGTAFCYLLRSDGKLYRCSLAYGLEHRPEYEFIRNITPERYFDLSKGWTGFSEWSSKFPIDLCYHCTFWKHENTVWENLSE